MSVLSFTRTSLQVLANRIEHRDMAESEFGRKRLGKKVTKKVLENIDRDLRTLLFSERKLILRLACREMDRIDRVTEDFLNLMPGPNEDD